MRCPHNSTGCDPAAVLGITLQRTICMITVCRLFCGIDYMYNVEALWIVDHVQSIVCIKVCGVQKTINIPKDSRIYGRRKLWA